MAQYPNEIYTPRVVVNRPGTVYDPLKTKVQFAEDTNNPNDEIVAIETILGTEPAGAYDTVKAWLSALASAIGAIVVPTKATGAEINTGTDDAKFVTAKAIADSDIAFLSDITSGVPSGSIILWSGAVASIPSGWFLCDGNNGTPNLVNRFIVGAGSSYNVGATGGEASHTLTIAEMPSHNHGGVTGDDSLAGRVGPVVSDKGSSREETNPGSHNHTITAEGGGQAHNNLPPYYALAYIMKS